MAVLIAAADTSGEFTVADGGSVTLVLVPTTTAGLPSSANAQVLWKGGGAYNQPVARVDSFGIVIGAAGTYQVTKAANTAYTVERN